MPESITVPSAVRSALERIVDYAGLFPPAKLPLAEAVAEYERSLRGANAWMLGRFIVPASAIDALDAALATSDGIEATAIFDGETPVRSTARVRVAGCEVPLHLASHEIGATRTAVRALRKSLDALAPELPIAVEVPRGVGSALLAETMDALAQAGFLAKVRCGGLTADAAPSVAELADVVRAAVHARVPLKATAGLHHPVRHFNAEAGFVMHGFLNVLAAACHADESDTATLREIVGEERPRAFALDETGLWWNELLVADGERLARIRRDVFVGFGSCSFAEPVDDLIALGILPPR